MGQKAVIIKKIQPIYNLGVYQYGDELDATTNGDEVTLLDSRRGRSITLPMTIAARWCVFRKAD